MVRCSSFHPEGFFDTFDSFLNCQDGGKTAGRSILKVGVEQALEDAGFDNQAFLDRGGVFEWGRDREDQTDIDRLDW